MASGITLTETAEGEIPTPASGKATVFVDSLTGEPSYKDDTGTATSLKGAKGDPGEQGAAGEGVPAGGTSGQALVKTDGTDYNTEWKTLDAEAVGAIAASYLASKGDLVSYTGAAIATLAAGSNGQVLTADSAESAGLKWATPASGFVDPLTTKGDIMVYGTGTTRLAVGTNGYVLSADSSEATGLKWVPASSGGGGTWGSITGTLSDQTDLQLALDAKQDEITGLTASAAELNILDGATLSTTELNYVDGVTSAIQTQIDGKLTGSVSTPRAGEVVWHNGTTLVNGPRVTTSTAEPTSPEGGDIFFDQGNKAVKIWDTGSNDWDTVADVGGGGGGSYTSSTTSPTAIAGTDVVVENPVKPTFKIGIGPSAITGSGGSCVGIGYRAAYGSGNYKICIGYNTGYNASGFNVCLGHDAGSSAAAGVIAIGYSAGKSGGGSAVCIGNAAGTSVGAGVIAIGDSAGLYSGDNNIAIGNKACQGGVSGVGTTAIGYRVAWYPNGNSDNKTTTGARQTLIGYQTGQSSSTQVNDITCVGYQAIAGGTGSTALGSGAQATHAGATAIGFGTVTNRDNSTCIGARDLEITDATKGVILKSPDGNLWRVTVDNTGALTTAAV